MSNQNQRLVSARRRLPDGTLVRCCTPTHRARGYVCQVVSEQARHEYEGEALQQLEGCKRPHTVGIVPWDQIYVLTTEEAALFWLAYPIGHEEKK